MSPELELFDWDEIGDGRLFGLDWGGDTGAVGNREHGLMRRLLKSGATTGGRETRLFLLLARISLSTAVGGGGGGSEVR